MYSHSIDETGRNGEVHLQLNIRLVGIGSIAGISGQMTCVDETAPFGFYPEKVQGYLYSSTLVLPESFLMKDEEGRILLSLSLEMPDGSAFTSWIDLTGRLCKAYRESSSDQIVLDLEAERVKEAGIVVRFTGWQVGDGAGTTVNPSK